MPDLFNKLSYGFIMVIVTIIAIFKYGIKPIGEISYHLLRNVFSMNNKDPNK